MSKRTTGIAAMAERDRRRRQKQRPLVEALQFMAPAVLIPLALWKLDKGHR